MDQSIIAKDYTKITNSLFVSFVFCLFADMLLKVLDFLKGEGALLCWFFLYLLFLWKFVYRFFPGILYTISHHTMMSS